MSHSLAPPVGYSDPSSVSEPSRIRTSHIELNLTIDFEKEIIKGTATLTLSVIDPTVDSLILDGRDLSISEIQFVETGEKLDFVSEKDYTEIGDRIIVELGSEYLEEVHIKIFYSARGCGHPAGGAVDWSPKTENKQPFMFTQAQAVHARSFIPCQDTPSVKATYSARITVKEPYCNLMALMSAVYQGKEGNEHVFEQNVPIPSYLIAIAVGNLESRKVSERCTIWAEPDIVEKARWEFAEVELFLKTAEKLAGEYVWGVYDLLVLPSSFPYGGMENACLTFLTPSLLAGDRSLVNVVAHEIAHSWAGNLVTNRDAQHFWLNEGFTVKLERRILRELYGDEREGLDAHSGLETLNNYIAKMGADHPFTRLVTELEEGADPDDSFSSVPYEKGYFFLSYLEHMVESNLKNSNDYSFDDFTWEYFKRFSNQSISTDAFLTMFSAKFPEISKKVDWNTWLYSPGPCPKLAPINRSLVKNAVKLAKDWKTNLKLSEKKQNPGEFLNDIFQKESQSVRKWDSKQKQLFLAEMGKNISREESGTYWNEESCQVFEGLYEVDSETNSEIRMKWCVLGLRAHRQKSADLTAQFLKSTGRMKFVRPLFLELSKTYPGYNFAKELFLDIRDSYHDICAKMVARDLGLKD